MPPKKKKSGKKGKKGKKSGKASASGGGGKSEHLSELSKEFYLIQIRDLENRLGRYQKKCDELTVKNGQFREQYDQMATDKKEIVSFLKQSLEQRGDEIADLNDRLIGLQQARDSEKEQYETGMQQLRTEFQETKDQLTSENMILGGKLASLEEFKVQKEDLMAKFAAMEGRLGEQEEHHKGIIYSLERKQVVDKDRLKKEMVHRVNQVASEFRKVSNKQMAETTKRTIRENVSINAQLAKMSDKTMELITENDDVKVKDKKNRQTCELLEINEKEFAKKNHSNQKIIRMLTEKCKSLEGMLAELEERENEYQGLESENDMLRQQIEAVRDELQSISKDHELLEDDLQGLQTDLSTERKGNKKLEKVLLDCADALKTALRKNTSEDVEETVSSKVLKRDNMLEQLLVLLNSAAAIGLGPKAQDLGTPENTRNRSASQMPGSGAGIRPGDMPYSELAPGPLKPGGGTLNHYQLGDLGLIPRPAHLIPTHLQQMKELSTTTRLGNLKKVLTKSVAVQTVSAPKAMFFADQLLSRMPTNLIHDLSPHERDSLRPGGMPVLGSVKKVPSKVF